MMSAKALGGRRVLLMLAGAILLALLNGLPSSTVSWSLFARALVVGCAGLIAFGIFEQWPRRLPRALPRWVLQLTAVVISVPPAALLAFALTHGGFGFVHDEKILLAWMFLAFTGILFSPWFVLGGLMKQREHLAHEQAMAFELERSRYEREALAARLRLLQAQVQPHFLFNTLANVQTLVDTGSPQASRVISSLVTYLRSAVPKLEQRESTLGQELQSVQAYLDLMQMRMPDRLTFSIAADTAARDVMCPPLTVLTLVENAIRHGIDPAEEGGHIGIEARVANGRCALVVTDSGVGLRETQGGLGTGLATLRERLLLAFGGDASVDVTAVSPHGVRAAVEFPARRTT